MVNSGSSANLLASFALINPLKKINLDLEINLLSQLLVVHILMATCSMWFKPKFIDINPDTFCLNEELLKKRV